MWHSFKEYTPAIFKWWWVIVMGFAGGTIGAILSIQRGLDVPIWVWVAIALVGLFIAQFLAFHKIRAERDQLRIESSTAKQVSSRLFSIQYQGDIDFSTPMTRGFPDSPSGEKLMLRILVGFVAIPAVLVESVTLEVIGKRIPSNWESAGIGQSYGQYIYFGIPNWVNPGKHSVRLFAFADGKEWSSEEFSVDFPEQKTILI